MRHAPLLLLALAIAPGSCKSDDTTPPADLGPTVDDEVGASDISETPDLPESPVPLPTTFPFGMVSTSVLGGTAGARPFRTIIHAHSIYSHDACDGDPVLKNGAPNEECLDSLRAALCTDHIDVIMLSEHYTLMSGTPFELLFLHREGDEWVDEGGEHAANAVVCEDGHRALIMPGLEGSAERISSLGLTDHPVQGDEKTVEAAYKDASPEGIQKLRDVGAVTVAIHLENWSKEVLHAADVDAVEIGNLHALIAPDIRETLGLDKEAPILAFTDWLFAEDGRAPDLVFLEFHERVMVYNDQWDDLLAKRMITGFAGNDVHQNVLPLAMPDGDRPDSYRRMMKWYVNHLMVETGSPAEVREALRKGRLYMVFEILGSPHSFDFSAESGDETWRMGDTVPAAAREAGLRLRSAVPAAVLGDASVEPTVAMRLFRITETGGEVVWDAEGALDFEVKDPGRYRLEVFVTPTHLAGYLAGRADLVRELPWIYTNAIEVQ